MNRGPEHLSTELQYPGLSYLAFNFRLAGRHNEREEKQGTRLGGERAGYIGQSGHGEPQMLRVIHVTIYFRQSTQAIDMGVKQGGLDITSMQIGLAYCLHSSVISA